jgi:hypothetical protein
VWRAELPIASPLKFVLAYGGSTARGTVTLSFDKGCHVHLAPILGETVFRQDPHTSPRPVRRSIRRITRVSTALSRREITCLNPLNRFVPNSDLSVSNLGRTGPVYCSSGHSHVTETFRYISVHLKTTLTAECCRKAGLKSHVGAFRPKFTTRGPTIRPQY